MRVSPVGRVMESGSISLQSEPAEVRFGEHPLRAEAQNKLPKRGGYVALEGADGKKLYYTKRIDVDAELPLYVRPLAGGAEKQGLAGVRYRAFQVFDDGIYYITGAGLKGNEIRFYDLGSERSRVVASIEGQLSVGVSVSPDRNTFLFSKVVSEGSDLMLIENFR